MQVLWSTVVYTHTHTHTHSHTHLLTHSLTHSHYCIHHYHHPSACTTQQWWWLVIEPHTYVQQSVCSCLFPLSPSPCPSPCPTCAFLLLWEPNRSKWQSHKVMHTVTKMPEDIDTFYTTPGDCQPCSIAVQPSILIVTVKENFALCLKDMKESILVIFWVWGKVVD